MDKQTKIEVMAKAIPNNVVAYDRNPAGQHLYIEQREEIAERLIEQGYGNVNQALTEFAKRLIENFIGNESIGGYSVVRDKSPKQILYTIEKILKEFTGNADIS